MFHEVLHLLHIFVIGEHKIRFAFCMICICTALLNTRMTLLFLRTRVVLGGQKAPTCYAEKQIMWSFTTAAVSFSITTSSKKVAPNDCDNERQSGNRK